MRGVVSSRIRSFNSFREMRLCKGAMFNKFYPAKRDPIAGWAKFVKQGKGKKM